MRLQNIYAALVMGQLVLGSASAFPEYPPLSDWEDFDTVVAESYGSLTNDAAVYPPTWFRFSFHTGFYLFDDSGDFASATNIWSSQPILGVPAWWVSVIETQAAERVWISIGVGDAGFRTNAVTEGFDPGDWVRDGYGAPPAHLAGLALDEWYAFRDRSRLILVMTFVASNDWPALQEAFAAAATNTPVTETPPPLAPADTNRLAFAGIEPGVSNAVIRLWLYSPERLLADLFCRDRLNAPSLWTLRGTLATTAPFDPWDCEMTGDTGFYHAARADVDTDGDGIPDGRETLAHGTDPEVADSDGDGISDFDEIYRDNTDPWNPDAEPPEVQIEAPAAGSREVVLP